MGFKPKDQKSYREDQDESSLWDIYIWSLVLVFLIAFIFHSKPASASGSQVGSADSVASAISADLSTDLSAGAAKNFTDRFKLTMGLEYEQTLHEPGAYDQAAESSVIVSPSFELSENYTFSVLGILAKEHTSEDQRLIFANTRLSVSRKALPVYEFISFAPVVSLIAPTNRFSVESDRFQGALRTGGNLNFDFKKTALPVTASLGLMYVRNFHEFTLNAKGSPNIRETLTPSLSLGLGFAEGKGKEGKGKGKVFELRFSSAFVSAWSYRGVVQNRFEMAQALAYRATEKINLYVGHSNAGRAFKANGRESNMALFDKNASTVQAGTEFNF